MLNPSYVRMLYEEQRRELEREIDMNRRIAEMNPCRKARPTLFERLQQVMGVRPAPAPVACAVCCGA